MNSLDKTLGAQDSPDPSGEDALAQLASRDQVIANLMEVIRARDIKIQALTLELAYLRRIRFGARNEAFNAEQRQLFEDDTDQDITAIEADLWVPPAPQPQAKSRTGRQALPDHLERIEVRHEPESCTCSFCQSYLVKISEDISEQLDVEPARFFVHRHIPRTAPHPATIRLS